MANPTIEIKRVNKKPNNKHWSYPIEEIDYIFEQIKDGDREDGETFLLYDGRLYEEEETQEGL